MSNDIKITCYLQYAAAIDYTVKFEFPDGTMINLEFYSITEDGRILFVDPGDDNDDGVNVKRYPELFKAEDDGSVYLLDENIEKEVDSKLFDSKFKDFYSRLTNNDHRDNYIQILNKLQEKIDELRIEAIL